MEPDLARRWLIIREPERCVWVRRYWLEPAGSAVASEQKMVGKIVWVLLKVRRQRDCKGANSKSKGINGKTAGSLE
jgi:hypothetical protein